MKLSHIASVLNVRLENESTDTEITGLNGIEKAGPGELTFISNPKYAAAARSTKASAVLVAEDFAGISTAKLLRAKDPYLSFARALELFHPGLRYEPGVHKSAVVHTTAKIGRNPHLGPYVVVGENVEIGDNAVLLAHVVIYRGVKIGNNFFAHAQSVVREDCIIGNNVLLQNGVVIGSDGFGFAKTHDARWHKTTWKCRRIPASIVPASARRASGAGLRSIISYRLAMDRKWAKMRCYARRSDLRVPRKLASA
jgi:UDP-3-O-[3-hydroxymyristoyl] glucosamine N-acyltransferase